MNIVESGVYGFIKDYLDDIEVLEYKNGEYIDKSIDESSCIYYILQGTVRVQNLSCAGNKIIIDELSKEEFVGHISSLRGMSFHCDIIAKEQCALVKISRALLNDLLRNIEFASFFYEKTSRRLYCMYKNLLLEKLFHWEEIVAYYILEHSKDNVFIYKSMYDICEHLNISRRGLYNIINRMVYEECLEKRDNLFYIKDKPYLQELASNIYEYYS